MRTVKMFVFNGKSISALQFFKELNLKVILRPKDIMRFPMRVIKSKVRSIFKKDFCYDIWLYGYCD